MDFACSFLAQSAVLGKVASIFAYRWSQRQEYAADLAGAKLTSPEAHTCTYED
jgi:Zn-dependent protease with chaperone function